MLSSRALIVDYNGTFVPGYEEIPLAYAFLSKAVREMRFGRALKLGIPLQLQCWYLTLAHKLDKVGKVFAEQVLVGEDPEYIRQVIERPDSTLYKLARGLPKVGRKMDTEPSPMAVYIVDQARKKGKKTGVYSASFQQIIEATLRRYGELDNFDVVHGNPFLVQDGKIVGVEVRVDFEDKAKGFEDFLESQGLPTDGSGVIYIGDDQPDKPVFSKVEHAIVSPTAKDDFREECADTFSGQGKLYTPRNWEAIGRLFGMD